MPVKEPTRAQLNKMARFSEYLLRHYPLTSAMVYAISHYVLFKILMHSAE